MTQTKPLEIRDVRPEDGTAWRRLYAGYRAFYALPDDPGPVASTWEWIIGRRHGLTGLVAVDETGDPIGLANLREFARPSAGAMGIYLDDLFTAPEARGRGVATALLERAATIAHDRGASVVRWITAEDNVTARRVYDENAVATHWVTYDMSPSA